MSTALRARRLIDAEKLKGVVALAIYLVLAICVFGLPVISDLSGSYIGAGFDPAIFMWDLVWWPYAIAHRLNPLVASVLWAPSGFNLAWGIGMPGPSLLLSPVTRSLGPVATYNLSCMLAPAIAAWAAFLLCRYISGSFWAALGGGYLFGFSSYILGQALNHVFLTLVFPVPLALYLVLLRFHKAIGAPAFVALLTLALTFQFLVSTELFATTTIFGAMAFALSLLVLPEDQRKPLRQMLPLIAAAYGLIVIPLLPYLYRVAGGLPLGVINAAHKYSADLLNFLVPTSVTLIGQHSFTNLAGSFVGNVSEQGAYIGPGLFVMVFLFAHSQWHKPSSRLLIWSLTFVCIASLGPVLHVAGMPVIPLPWLLVRPLPLANQALPARFVMYSSLIMAIVAALYLSSREVPLPARTLVAGFSLLFVLPNWSYRYSWISRVDTPAFFSSGDYRRYLSRGDNVIVMPYGINGNSMLWQAETGMYFRMVGGYIGLTPVEFERWPVLRTLYHGHAGLDFPQQLNAFLGRYQVKAIILVGQAREPWSRLLSTVGMTRVPVDDILLYRVPQSVLVSFANAPPDQMAANSALIHFSALISGAQRYLAQGLPLDRLTPQEVERLGLASLHWNKELNVKGDDPEEPRGWQDDLFLGAWGHEGILAGIEGFREGLDPLIRRYGRYADRVSFPYPKKFSPARRVMGHRTLVMFFSREQLRRAATLAESSGRAPDAPAASRPVAPPRAAFR